MVGDTICWYTNNWYTNNDVNFLVFIIKTGHRAVEKQINIHHQQSKIGTTRDIVTL
jgi:hypothetical protein